jgi:uncharacterized SAM-binding protein YcdF (DUF218 family)
VFFILSKTLGVLATPSSLILVLGFCGAVLLANDHARSGLECLLATVLLLAIFGFSPLPNALIRPLKRRFPPWDSTRGAPDGIVVLGGGFKDRIPSAVELARKYPDARIVFSGGSGRIFWKRPTEAGLAKRFFERSGVSGRIIAEDRSRNTAENAKFTKAVIHPKSGERWLLVTAAYHMPRAIGAFRRAGFPIEAYPVASSRRGSREGLANPFRMARGGLKRTDAAVHEWIGLFAYWLTGRSSKLFPGP